MPFRVRRVGWKTIYTCKLTLHAGQVLRITDPTCKFSWLIIYMLGRVVSTNENTNAM